LNDDHRGIAEVSRDALAERFSIALRKSAPLSRRG